MQGGFAKRYTNYWTPVCTGVTTLDEGLMPCSCR